MKKQKIFFSIVLFLLVSIFIYAVPPSIPATILGFINQGDAPEGLLLEARIDGQSYAETLSEKMGGSTGYTLVVPGDDPDTPEKDGGVSGDKVSIYVEDILAAETVWLPGGEQINLDIDLSDFDADGDGFASRLDCDDSDEDINPDADEVCNGLDDDCDGEIDEGNVCDECLEDSDCDDGLFCNGQESCVSGECVSGERVDCSGNDISPIARCDHGSDDYVFTFDFYPGFTSVCDEEMDACTAGDVVVEHSCDVDDCNAECDSQNLCEETECDDKDGCYGNDYRDYDDVDNSCLDSCTCEENTCSDFSVSEDDPRCVECQVDSDCPTDEYLCSGNNIVHQEGLCIDNSCEVQESIVEDCSSDEICTGPETGFSDDFSCVLIEDEDDADEDGVNDEDDNCPFMYNPEQEDIDGDDVGNVCDDYDDRQIFDEPEETVSEEDDMKIASLSIPDVVGAGEDFYFRVNMDDVSQNEDVKVSAYIFDLGLYTSRKMDLGGSSSVALYMDIPDDVKPGEYYMRITISGNGIHRVKHRPLMID